MELLAKDEVYAIVGAAMEVHTELGSGFLEAVYQEALEMELADRGIPFEAHKDLRIMYEGRPLKKTYVANFFVYGSVMVEIKAMDRLTTKEEAQILNFLKASKIEVGVLINFGASPKLEWSRHVWSEEMHNPRRRAKASPSAP